MKYSFALMGLVCMVALATMGADAMPPYQCNPKYIDEVSLRIRKVCKLLNTLEEFNTAMETYANRQGVEGLPLLDSGVKRQDVDHVFLRFGRKKR